MNTQKKFLKPGTDPVTGQPFQVFLPSKGRNIFPEGEALVLDSYLEKRVLSGELVKGVSRAEKPTTKDAKSHNNKPTTGGEK